MNLNPHMMHATYLPIRNPATGAKVYKAAFLLRDWKYVCRGPRTYKTATEAKQHARAVLERWKSLYRVVVTNELGLKEAQS